MGKSTSAQILARDHGFVYYEADAFGLMKNPFIDVNAAEASLATTKQKGIKGHHYSPFITSPPTRSWSW